ncbi:NUDIX hydrolase [Gymnodinialimonas sp.]
MSAAVDPARHLTEQAYQEERDTAHPPAKVRDASSLIVFDPAGPSVLMGRRSTRHTFMPGRFVFPGGRVDAADSRVPVALPYHPATARKLATSVSKRLGETRVRAFGIAALRETFEETGVLVGRDDLERIPRSPPFAAFKARGLALDLSALSFVARAITPPGRPRRYDTRFFLVARDKVAAIDETLVGGANAELEEIAWVPVETARTMDLPTITHTVIDEVMTRLAEDPALSPDAPVPFYRWQRKAFTRQLL